MKRVVRWKYSLIIKGQRRPTRAVEGVVVLRNHKKDKSTTINCQLLRVYTSPTSISLFLSIVSLFQTHFEAILSFLAAGDSKIWQ